MRWLILCGVLLWAQVVGAATAVIEGPASSSPGDLVVLDATKSDAASFEWTLIPSGKAFLPVDGGTKVVFASGSPGVYTFICSTAKENDVAVAVHILTIGTPPPVTPPLPPQPPQPPPSPSGKRQVVIFHESSQTNPELARLYTSMQAGAGHKYLESKGHRSAVLDVDATGPDGKPAPAMVAWKDLLADIDLPALVIIEDGTRLILSKSTLPPKPTWPTVLSILQQHGG